MKKIVIILGLSLIVVTSCKVNNSYHYEERRDQNVLVLNDGTTEVNAIPIKTRKKNIIYLNPFIIQKENNYIKEPCVINDSCYIKNGNKYNTVTVMDRDGDTATIFFLIKDRK